MHEHHGQAGHARLLQADKLRAQRLQVRLPQYGQALTRSAALLPRPRRDLVIRFQHPDPFIHFHHGLMQKLGQGNGQIEQPGPVLVSDPANIPESPGYDQRRARAFSFQQGIGGHGRAHADPINIGRVHGPPGRRSRPISLQDPADAFGRRVRILLRIFGQELDEPKPRLTRNLGEHVRKRAAAVDGKTILGGIGHGGHYSPAAPRGVDINLLWRTTGGNVKPPAPAIFFYRLNPHLTFPPSHGPD